MSEPGADGAALARGWLERSPFVAHLGIVVEELRDGYSRLSLPFAPSLPTLGDVVHGGAISSLADTAAAAAAWSGAEVPERPAASTIGITIDFLAPARATDLTAEARVIRRTSRGICFVEVSVSGGDRRVAAALVTYQL